MTFSANHTTFSEISSRKLSVHTRAVLAARLRFRLYNFIMEKFRAEDGLTRAELARRTGRAPAVITRYLSGPGNWTIDTVSDLLAGISGEELMLDAAAPSERSNANLHATDLPVYRSTKHTASSSGTVTASFVTVQ